MLPYGLRDINGFVAENSVNGIIKVKISLESKTGPFS